MNKNIAYQTDQLARYFSQHRVTWQQFYESERAIISQMHLDHSHDVLDIGCGCGGLGLALQNQFGVENYTGVEINPLAVEAARTMNPEAHILCGDILDLRQEVLRDKHFHVVFSLSCVDWNVQFSDMLEAAWAFVDCGGYLVATFRLVAREGCNDIARSFQYINFDGAMEGEHASYVVLNARDLIRQLVSFNPAEIKAFGYYGTPSATAVTPYETLCFAAFSIRKRPADDVAATRFQLDLPKELLDFIGGV